LSFDSTIAEHRFGYGLSPNIAPPSSVAAMLKGVSGEDTAQTAFPISSFRDLQNARTLRLRFRDFARKSPNTAEGKAAGEKEQKILNDMRNTHEVWFVQWILRRITTRDAFRETSLLLFF